MWCPPTRTCAPTTPASPELQVACEAFCERVNQRVHRETRAVPADRLAHERRWLHALPVQPYVAALGQTRRVTRSSVISPGEVRFWRAASAGRRDGVCAPRRRRGRNRPPRHRRGRRGRPPPGVDCGQPPNRPGPLFPAVPLQGLRAQAVAAHRRGGRLPRAGPAGRRRGLPPLPATAPSGCGPRCVKPWSSPRSMATSSWMAPWPPPPKPAGSPRAIWARFCGISATPAASRPRWSTSTRPKVSQPGTARRQGGEPMTATSQELEAEVDRLAGRLRLPYLRRAAAETIPTGRSQRFRPRAKCCAWCWPKKPPAATRPASPTGAAEPAFPPARPSTRGTPTHPRCQPPPNKLWAVWNGFAAPRTWRWWAHRAPANHTCWKPWATPPSTTG